MGNESRPGRSVVSKNLLSEVLSESTVRACQTHPDSLLTVEGVFSDSLTVDSLTVDYVRSIDLDKVPLLLVD